MAGSIAHTVNEDGSLMTPEEINDSLENGGDVYEAIEEYYYENRHYKTENASLRKRVEELEEKLKAKHSALESWQLVSIEAHQRIVALIEAGDAMRSRLALVTSSAYDRELCERWNKTVKEAKKGGE